MHSIIAIQCEQSLVERTASIGLKLDRSKCFDRVLPLHIQAFGEALGMDRRFFVTWLQLYSDFKRYLSFGQFIHDTELSNCNGVAQGDSASVLAINLLMCGWTLLMSKFPDIRSYIFIDDVYVFCKLELTSSDTQLH